MSDCEVKDIVLEALVMLLKYIYKWKQFFSIHGLENIFITTCMQFLTKSYKDYIWKEKNPSSVGKKLFQRNFCRRSQYKSPPIEKNYNFTLLTHCSVQLPLLNTKFWLMDNIDIPLTFFTLLKELSMPYTSTQDLKGFSSYSHFVLLNHPNKLYSCKKIWRSRVYSPERNTFYFNCPDIYLRNIHIASSLLGM